MSKQLKRIAFLGTSGGVCFSKCGFNEAMIASGENTGNFLFQYAMWEIIKNPKSPITFSEDVGYVRENFDLIVIPAANQVNPHWDLGWWAKFIEDVDLPVVIIGLGAQASIDSSPKLSLSEGTQRFLRVIMERASKIGVRGEFTQEVLRNMGVENTVVTGCPSNFINFNISGKGIYDKIDRIKKSDKFSSYYLFGTMEPYIRKYEKILFKFAQRYGSKIIYQTNDKILSFLHDGRMDEGIQEYINWERSILAPAMSLEDYFSYIKSRGIFFSHAAHWIDQAGRVDVSYGMRIHGAIAAIQGGALGVCVAFDSRTKELVNTMKYPYIVADDLEMVEKRGGDIWSVIRFDADDFDKQRRILWDRYASILKEAGIEISFGRKSGESNVNN